MPDSLVQSDSPLRKNCSFRRCHTAEQQHRQQQERRIRSARMKLEQWKTYRTRFLVKAKQLNSGLSFIDHLGRQHCGRKGDYLVESCDGVLSIAPKQIFEDIYVTMPVKRRTGFTSKPQPDLAAENANRNPNPTSLEVLNIERIKNVSFHPRQNAVIQPSTPPPPVRRKMPQPFRQLPSGISLM